MKEKYIFFILLIVALILFLGSAMGRKDEGKISAKELAIEKKLKQVAKKEITSPGGLDIDKVQDLVAFSQYEAMLKRSPFFKVQPKQAKAAKAEKLVIPVEETTPRFVYKGKIIAGMRLLVLIEQTRSNETLMAAKGENVDGYKVLDITDTEVILSKKGEENIVLKTIETP